MVIILKIIVKTDYKCYTLVVYIINVVKNLIIIKETKILMKNKKLTLTCGIILVICASLSIVGAFSVVTQTVNTLLWTPIEREGYNTFITWTILEAVYALVINIAQAIVYMIFGVKLIKNSKTDSDATQNKTKIITLIVLVGCSLIFDSREFAACLAQGSAPINKEVAKEIAKGIKEGLNEEDGSKDAE